VLEVGNDFRKVAYFGEFLRLHRNFFQSQLKGLSSIIFRSQPILYWSMKVIICAVCVYYIGLFLYIGLSRFAFPFPFDWVEGPIFVQINRVLVGQKLYVEPSATYVPLVYQPVYFYLAAVFTKLFGLGLGSSRFLSILASCVSCLAIFQITRKVTGSWFPGIVSTGFFAATNGIVWTWFDFAKVDMLFVMFSLLGLFFLIQADLRSAILAGVFFTLSFFTKQSAIIIILPACIFYFLRDRMRVILILGLTGVLTMAGIFFLNLDSHGWYYFYTFTLPSYHRLDASPAHVIYILKSMIQPILFFLGLVFCSIILVWKKGNRTSQFNYFYALAGCIVVFSLLSALSIGTTRNAFIPAYAMLAIVIGMGLQTVQGTISRVYSGNIRFIGNTILLIACLLQFLNLQYSSRDYIPSAHDYKRAAAMIKKLRNTTGEMIIPSQNYLALYVQKKVFYHDAPLGEFNGWYGKSLPAWAGLQREIQEIVRSGEVSFVFLAEPDHAWMGLRCEKVETLRSQSKFVPTFYKMVCQ